MHLKQLEFTYSGSGPFTENKERIEKFMQTGNTDYIYKNDLDKACFQHDTTYGLLLMKKKMTVISVIILI